MKVAVNQSDCACYHALKILARHNDTMRAMVIRYSDYYLFTIKYQV